MNDQKGVKQIGREKEEKILISAAHILGFLLFNLNFCYYYKT